MRKKSQTQKLRLLKERVSLHAQQDPSRCNLEIQIEEALKLAGVCYLNEQQHNFIKHTERRLDFYLPDFDTYIEVKRGHTPRAILQMSEFNNVILTQGVLATDTLSRFICTTPFRAVK